MKTLMYVLVRALQRSWHNRMRRDSHWLPTSGAPHPESASYEMESLENHFICAERVQTFFFLHYSLNAVKQLLRQLSHCLQLL